MANWYEEGSEERQTKTTNKKTGHPTGKITATHFFAKALESTEKETIDSIYQKFCEAHEKIIAKYTK
jgi:hypothetical protein